MRFCHLKHLRDFLLGCATFDLLEQVDITVKELIAGSEIRPAYQTDNPVLTVDERSGE